MIMNLSPLTNVFISYYLHSLRAGHLLIKWCLLNEMLNKGYFLLALCHNITKPFCYQRRTMNFLSLLCKHQFKKCCVLGDCNEIDL